MIILDKTAILCALIILSQIAVIIYFIRSRRIKARHQKKHNNTPENAYSELRKLALQVTPHQLKLAIPNSDLFIYGLVMDWDMGKVTVTLAAYITGACSLYLNTGGGFIKGGQDPEVAEMAVELLTLAKDYINMAAPVDTTGLPGPLSVRFYFLTNHRMYAGEEKMERFDDSTSPWLPFFEKANVVISGMRSKGHGALSDLN